MSKDLNARVLACVRAWGITIQRTVATKTSLLVHGKRAGTPVVLKVVKEGSDEWRCGEIAAKFGGRGVVQVYEHMPGAALLEKLDPGEPLAALTLAGRDDEATDILAMLLGRMVPGDPPVGCPTVEQWAGAFVRHAGSGDERVPSSLVEPAQRIYSDLCRTQRNPALLHGDLHHYNVLLDRARGWTAIDPKGVVGEIEYEIGAAIRNPVELPDLVTDCRTIERRLTRFCSALDLDAWRVMRWCYSQAVLSAIWGVEDGDAVGPDNLALRLATVLEPMLA